MAKIILAYSIKNFGEKFMCGISGIINKSDTQVSIDDIKIINNIIQHRGPNDEGIYVGDNFALGHRQLSILDLSKDGHQPMNYMDKYIITYNGEIYNYIELRDELKEYGYKFKSRTDTEVILAAYDKWKKQCVSHFNGMWAFAIYDKDNSEIFCSRDRFGIKPFYYSDKHESFSFGSEIKQLLALSVENVVNKNILLDYLVLNFIIVLHCKALMLRLM